MKFFIALMMYCCALQVAIGQEEAPPVPPTPIIDTVVEVFGYTGERMPEFPGGTKALFAFIDSTIRYPIDLQACIEGKVVAQFLVKEDGTIDLDKIKIARGIHPLLDAEAIRVLKLMPKWIPGTKRGKPVPTWFTLPVAFKLK